MCLRVALSKRISSTTAEAHSMPSTRSLATWTLVASWLGTPVTVHLRLGRAASEPKNNFRAWGACSASTFTPKRWGPTTMTPAKPASLEALA
eukprot:2787704-Alexandrium_andersonii.AAC.1